MSNWKQKLKIYDFFIKLYIIKNLKIFIRKKGKCNKWFELSRLGSAPLQQSHICT